MANLHDNLIYTKFNILLLRFIACLRQIYEISSYKLGTGFLHLPCLRMLLAESFYNAV